MYTLPHSEIATCSKIKGLLTDIDRQRDPDPFVAESGSLAFFSRAGTTYHSHNGPLTILCETPSEVCYFQAGLFFFINEYGFRKLTGAHDRSRVGYMDSEYYCGMRSLTDMDVEFILGILSAMDPMACCMVFGNDLVQFIAVNKKSINDWTMKIASLMLSQNMLKRYARKLYQRVSGVLVDGAWSKLSESLSTDDASIARFAGFLLGSYRTRELMEKIINARWSIFFHILKTVDAALRRGCPARHAAERMHGSVEGICHSFGRLGVHITNQEARSFLDEAESHPNEIGKVIEILRKAFDKA